MTDTPARPGTGERVAKVIARSGIASRRDAEKMILAGKVAVNGKQITTPALDVTSGDKVTIDGKPIDAPQQTRLWLYYKPLGLITTEKDEQGRRTIFDEMPGGMPRVLNIGRLDLNSEGLLLLTNDGGLKRRLEHPATGWLRKYRVRVNGRPNEATFDPLRRGITIDGDDFQPMEISLDRQQGANAWLTVGIREGKNREIRRAMSGIGLQVNRLIRIGYGPFRLLDMKPGDVTEVKRKMLRDQLGGLLDGSTAPGEAPGEAPAGARDRADRGRDGKSQNRSQNRFDHDGGNRDRGPRPGGRKSHRDDAGKGGFDKRGPRPEGGKPRFERNGAHKPRFGGKPGSPGGRDGGKPGFERNSEYKPRQRSGLGKPREEGGDDSRKGPFKSAGFKSHRGGKSDNGGKPRAAGHKPHRNGAPGGRAPRPGRKPRD